MVGEPDRPGHLPEHRVRPAGDEAATAVHLGVVNHEHVRPVDSELGGDRGQAARWKPVVAVDEPHVVTARVLQADVTGLAEPGVRRQVSDPHPGVSAGVVVENGTGPVRRGVVNPDDLDRAGFGLDQDRVQAFGNVRLDLMCWDDDGKQRRCRWCRSCPHGREACQMPERTSPPADRSVAHAGYAEPGPWPNDHRVR